jgi:hypothetical protein
VRFCYNDGSIYIGQSNNHNWTEGKKYELQEGKTHTLFKVKYDEEEKEIEKKEISRGHKMV